MGVCNRFHSDYHMQFFSHHLQEQSVGGGHNTFEVNILTNFVDEHVVVLSKAGEQNHICWKFTVQCDKSCSTDYVFG